MNIDQLMEILFINLILIMIYEIGYLLFGKQNKTAFAIKTLFMLICPIAGPCVIFFCFLFYSLFFSHRKPFVGEKKKRKQGEKENVKRADEERMRSIVSMEDALTVMDAEGLRNFMQNMTRTDVKNSLESLAKAVESTEKETAHQAAALLQDELSQFQEHVRKYLAFSKIGNERQAFYASDLIDYMDGVLRQHVFPAENQKYYVGKMEETAEILYQNDENYVSGQQFEAVCLRLLEVQDYEKCKIWCDRALSRYPELLSTYKCQLKYYSAVHDREGFLETLEQLKNSDIVIDKDTLEMIRVFQ